jgi:hypothetical protein
MKQQDSQQASEGCETMKNWFYDVIVRLVTNSYSEKSKGW